MGLSGVHLGLGVAGALALAAGVRARGQRNVPTLFYHGTSVEAAEGILRDGLKGSEGGRHQQSPLKGHIYLTHDLPEALAYTFGGYVSHSLAWVNHGRKPVGAVVVLRPTGPCLPDEDWVGRMAMAVRPRSNPRLHDTETSALLREHNLHYVFTVSIPELVPMTARERERAGEAAYESQYGKRIVRTLKRLGWTDRLARMAAVSPARACDPKDVEVVGVYRLRAEDLPRLSPDGSNLGEVGARMGEGSANTPVLDALGHRVTPARRARLLAVAALAHEQIVAMETSDLDKLAWGFRSGDRIRVPLARIHPDDAQNLEAAEDEVATWPHRWVPYLNRAVGLTLVRGGRLVLADGHHRFVTARRNGLTVLPAIVHIDANPIPEIQRLAREIG